MKEGPFRPAAIEALNAPEKGTVPLQTPPSLGWLVPISLALLIGCLAAWAWNISVPIEAIGNGSLSVRRIVYRVGAWRIKPGYATDQGKATLFVRAGQPFPLQEGMPVLLSPDHAAPERYGFLEGKVSHLQNVSGGVEVEVELLPSLTNEHQFRWTLQRGASFPLFPYTPCQGKIVVAQRRLIDSLFPPRRKQP